ncbi:MAG: excinuclease ABC subunit A, partial [Clostridia bacterium]|nr:excinuclease ABC subunit A [Clostridia bacterium]
MKDEIIIKGAKENNLKDINLTLPRNKFIVFSGVSGSGKSTLAFDTIFAEGQRRFIESLSSYARQFLGQMSKPNVESIEGLSPAISIDQKTTSHNPRSTVGTVTEIYDYFRLLFARLGVPYCPNCKKPISSMTVDNIVDAILSFEQESKVVLVAPVIRQEKGSFQKLFESFKKDGFARVEVDGKILELTDEISIDKNLKHDISVVVDRIKVREENRSRLTESVETALKLSKGLVRAQIEDKSFLYNNSYSCSECGFSFEEISPRLFSFNSPFGACPKCAGLGFVSDIDEKLILRHPEKTLRMGGLKISTWTSEISSINEMYLKALSEKYNFSLDVPVKDLPKDIMKILLYGNNNEQLKLKLSNSKFSGSYLGSWEGLIPNLQRRYIESKSEYVKTEISKLMRESECKICGGKRLNEKALSVFVGRKNIAELMHMCAYDLREFCLKLKFSDSQKNIAEPIMKEINARLTFLCDVGLDYLTLDRISRTLSGGEAQRIRLATQIGSGLVGVLYILDEPSIGLHQSDNEKLLKSLKRLRDLGNTLIVVEHDEDTIRQADYIVDIGPKAGVNGGEIVAQGSLQDIIK